MKTDWNKYGRRRVASCTRMLYRFNICAAVVLWLAILPFAIMHDWTLVLIPVVATAAATVNRLAVRSVYGIPKPDYAAIAAMEWAIWGRGFEHAGEPDERF